MRAFFIGKYHFWHFDRTRHTNVLSKTKDADFSLPLKNTVRFDKTSRAIIEKRLLKRHYFSITLSDD